MFHSFQNIWLQNQYMTTDFNVASKGDRALYHHYKQLATFWQETMAPFLFTRLESKLENNYFFSQ